MTTNLHPPMLRIGRWTLQVIVDADEHLEIFLAHDSKTDIYPCHADLANDAEWAERFTAAQIEANNKAQATR